MSGGRETVFGLDVESEAPLSFLTGAGAAATGRRLDLTLALGGADLEWSRGARLLSDEKQADGEVLFQIEASELGYRIAGPKHGTAILAADGSSLRGSLGSGGLPAWQRLLVAQALPFAAVLRGLEVFHASGVTVDGEAIALLGGSGSGKTSVALALCRQGAGFLADDVLAIERDGERLLAHPGAPIAGVERSEVERLRRFEGFDEARVLAADEREAIVRMVPSGSPRPVAGLFLLERHREGPDQPRFEPVLAPSLLLAATFNLVLLGAERLESLLDVCALAAEGAVERVVSGPGADASLVAEAVAERIGARV
ncbi:MAG: hypothetical protein ABW065_09945 [Solirubrobacterales bacterium]